MSSLCLCLMMKNEERFLEKCIESTINYVDEIKILDTGSNDKSVEIARKYTSNITYKKFNNNFSDMRNELLTDINSEWILYMDADEFFTDIDIKKVISTINTTKQNIGGIRFYRYNFFATGAWYSGKVLKLFRNNNLFKYEGNISESIDNSIEHNGFKIIDSDILLNHIGHTRQRIERDNKTKYYIELFKKELKKEPNNALFHGYIGINARLLGDFKTALKETKAALDINSKSATMHIFQGHVFRAMNKNEDALYSYKKALEFRTNDAAILNLIGITYMACGNLNKAEKYFINAYENNSSLIHSQLNLGLLKFYSQRYDEALNLFELVVERNSAFLYFNIEHIFESDPYQEFCYETIMNYSGLQSYISMCKDFLSRK